MHCLTENLIFTHRTVLIKTQVDLELIGDSLYGKIILGIGMIT